MKNGPHRLRCVNTWFPAGGTVWEGLGGIALLGKGCHGEWTLRFQQTANTPTWLSVSQGESFRLLPPDVCSPAAMPSAMMVTL